MTEIVTDTATPAPVVKLQLSKKAMERFERKFTWSLDGCWIWHGATTSKVPGREYGMIRMNGRGVLAHRIAFELNHRLLNDGEHALHKCDTPRCVRPDHLFAGSHTANMKDKEQKGRANHAFGERHSILTEKAVLEIRAKYRKRYGALTELAAEYGLTVSGIRAIVTRKSWTHL